MKKSIKCPECGKVAEYSPVNVFRPFCSERCKLIDLGEWIEGKYSIGSEENSHALDSLQEGYNTKH